MTTSTVTDLTHRLPARPAVVHLQREPATVIPLRPRQPIGEHAEAQIEKLLFALVQADCYAAHPSASAADQMTRRGEVHGYAYAIGIALHPEDPAGAHAVKRLLLGELAAGVNSIDELTAVIFGDPTTPEAG